MLRSRHPRSPRPHAPRDVAGPGRSRCVTTRGSHVRCIVPQAESWPWATVSAEGLPHLLSGTGNPVSDSAASQGTPSANTHWWTSEHAQVKWVVHETRLAGATG
jgi:hypothetical protein